MVLHNKKVLFITTGVITIIVFAGILACLLNIKAFKSQIEAAVSTALGADARIKGKINITFSPGFGLSLKNVSVGNRGSDFVTIEKMRIELKIFPITRKEFQISSIRLIKPTFSIVRYKNRIFNFDKPGDTPSGKPFAIENISISQGNLVYKDEISGEKIEVNNFDLILRNLSYIKRDSAEPAKRISFNVNILCKILKICNLTLTNLVMKGAGGKGILDINQVSMNIAGGTGNGNIHVDMTGPSPHYRVVYALNRVRIEELLQQYLRKNIPRKAIEGPINLSFDLTSMGKSADEVKRSLNGNLSLNGENLMLYNMDIDALIMKYERSQNFNLVDVGAILLVGPFGPLLTKSYHFTSLYEESQGEKGIIRKLISVWKVKNGIAMARDVALTSTKQRIAMKGELDFINERFDDVTIAVLDKKGCSVYSERVRGPFRKPQIEKESVFKSIAGPLINPLKNTWKFIQGYECTVFYSGSVTHPSRN